jgi:hypothetical protein
VRKTRSAAAVAGLHSAVRNPARASGKARAFSQSTVTIRSDDQQIVRIDGQAGLNLRHHDHRCLGSIGAEIQLVRGIEVEYGTECE